MFRPLLFSALTVFVISSTFLSAARAADETLDDCAKSEDANRKIAACSEIVRDAGESTKGRAAAFFQRGGAYSSKRDYDRAIADYSEAIRLDPKNALAFIFRAGAYYEKRDYSRTIADCNEAIRASPEGEHQAHIQCGRMYTKMGDYDRAIASIDEYMRLYPKYRDHYNALTARGAAYAEKGDYDRAIADVNRLIRLNPDDDGELISRRGRYFNMKGDYDRAVADVDKAIRLRHWGPDTKDLCVRGQAFLYKGDYDRAIADLNEVIKRDSKYNSCSFAARSELHARKGEFEDAIADSEAVIRARDDSLFPEIYAYRAYVFGRTGRIDEAFAEIRKAFELDPNNRDAMLYRGELHLIKGDVRSALADFDAVLAKSPQNRFALAGRREAVRKALAAPAPPPAASSAPPPTASSVPLLETRVALVIGNARYAAQSPLKNPSNDARAIAGALRGVGFRKVEVAENLSRDALVKALQAFQEEADRADWAVIYFSGHGVEIGGVNYAVPTDARLLTDRNAPDEAVSLDRLMASVGGAHKLRIVILDACRDNPFVASMRRTIASRSAGKGLAPVEPTRATLVVYAARDGQLAQDGAGDNSPFAAALARRLGEPHVEVSKLFRLVTDDVLDATGHRQQPFVYGSLPGREDFYFRP